MLYLPYRYLQFLQTRASLPGLLLHFKVRGIVRLSTMLTCVLLGCLLLPLNSAVAQNFDPMATPQYLGDPNDAYDRLGPLIGMLLTIAIFAGALVALAFFAIGAIQWGTAKGDAAAAAKARATMIYAAVGLFMLAGAYVFMVYFNNILPTDRTDPCLRPGQCLTPPE